MAQFTVTWNDAHEGKCSTQYNAYLVDYFVDTESVHLGSATSDDVQIVKSVDSSGMNGGLGYRVNLFCGDTDDYRFVSWIRLPSGLPSGTYSSEPALIGLVVDSGSLEPAFHQYKFSYVVDDVPASDDRITVTATAKDEYYGIVFVEGHVHYVGQGCGGTECLFNYSTESREKLGTLEDVDTVTPGFQLDLEEGQTDFSIHVHPLVDGGNVYQFSVTSTVTVRNSPATGQPTISGTAQVGEKLTADTSGIEDADGLSGETFTYQWVSSDGTSDTDIAGATIATYTPVSADEGQTIKVRVSFTDDADNQEMLTSAPTAAVAAPAQADSEDEPSELSYLTVVVTEDDSDPDNVFTTFTITWNDAEDCSASYNAYLDGVVGDPIHLGSAASEGEQIAASLTNVSAESMGFDAKLYCGMIGSGRLVDSLWIPEYSRSFDTVPISRAYLPKPGTYSTEPGLTVLTVSSGTLTPAFHSQTLNYTVPDVANADGRITLTTTKADYYNVAFIPGSLYFYIAACSHGGQQTSLSYRDDTGNPLYPLTDADANTPGFQMELDEGENVFKIHVWPNCASGHVYKLTVTRAANAPANTPATGAPTISGAAQVGETLTASTSGIADADGLTGATFSYQWLSSRDTEIQGATGAVYILVPGDAGKTIKVRVTFTDDEGNTETLTSAATGAVARRPNSPATGAPTIGGTAQVGQTLTVETSGIADADGLTGATFSYQWLSSRDTEIQGATGAAYILVPGDAGKTIKVRVTFTDDEGNAETLTSAATGAVTSRPNSPATGAPTIGGTAQVGQTLTASTSGIADADGLTGATFSYQWLSSRDTEIQGATGAAYILVPGDAGKTIKVRVTFTDDEGNAETLTSAATGAVASRPNSPATGAPTIGGTAQVGQTLTASTSGIADADGLTGATFSYQWLSSRDTEIQGATGAAYILVPGDAGKTIKVKVSFTDEAGNEETLTSEATAAVAAALPPPPGNVRAVTQKSGAVELTWEAPDGATVTGYRIERRSADQQRSDGRPGDNHTLVEDTGSADTGYTDQSAEKGVEYEYRVSARNESGPGEVSDWVRAVPESASNSPATGAPTIRGTTQVGETLTADITGIADADGLSGETFTYQWVSSDGIADTDIENATGATYKLVDADQGKAIKVRVTFTDGGGNEETLTSAPTGPVWGDGRPGAPRNLAATPGNKEVTLSWDPPADNGNAPATGYRIEWRVDGKDYDKTIWGTARSTTYTTTDQANLANGVKYFFRVRAGNGSGNSYGPYGPASEEVSATPTSGSAVDLGTPVLSNTENLHHGMVQLDWEDVEDAGWYVVQYYHVKGGEWLDLPAEGVDIAFHGSSAVVSNLHGLSWLRVRAMSCAGASEWSQIEQLFGTNASDWEGVPVPEVEEGDEIEPCPVVLGTPVLSEPETLHHGMVRLDWQDIEDAGWYVVQYYHVKGGEWLDLPAVGVDIAFHGSSAVVSNLHGLSWLRVRAMSCAGESEWSQIEQLFGTKASDWEGVPVPEVAEGDQIEPCSEDADTPDNSPATGAPTISGTAQVGETLTADTSGIADADGLGSVQYEYQWLADDADISGATNATYTLADTDEGKAISVSISFTDDAGNEETLTSAATDAVAAAHRTNSPATGAPDISGTAQVGETLTADTSGIADADGLANATFSYQWLADDTEIAGATGLTYTLTDSEESNTVKVQVSFTDDAGHNETLTSAATAAVVARPNSPATGAPTISGIAQVGETLTADTSGVADANGLSSVQYERQWLADDAEIAGATNSTYTLADTDEGKAIKVQVSFTDDAGNGEALTSAATDAVATAEPSEPPDKPKGLDATATHDSVTLTWDDPDDDSITGYVILRRIPGVDPQGHFDELVANTGTAATTYTDDTVASETRYTYRIKAIKGAGTSERSRWVHIDTPAAPVPDKPTGLEATASHNSVTLTWDDPGDDSITGYVILRRVRENDTGGDFDVLVADTASATTTYTDDTVAGGLTYTYRIKAINQYGASERSRWYHIDTPAAP